MAPSWQPTHSGNVGDGDDVRVGTRRPSMVTNPLLAKPELGKAKKMTFNNPSEDHVFGYTAPPDPEGAREVTMLWKEHAPSQGHDLRPDGKPHLDFTAMNKLASMSGLTSAKQLPAFREAHQVAVKKDKASKAGPGLPSDKDPRHTYGMASGHRTAEVVRTNGPEEPRMKHLVQGAYQGEWVQKVLAKGEDHLSRPYIPPVPTRAAVGHAIGAQQKYLRKEEATEEWKMTKFKVVEPRVTQYMGAKGGNHTGSAGAATQEAPAATEDDGTQTQE